MTQLLEQALEQIQALEDSEQDAIASVILEELADERRWEESFARSQGKLSQMAAKAREDVAAGRVKDKGIDEL